jgi:hypothetical protein
MLVIDTPNNCASKTGCLKTAGVNAVLSIGTQPRRREAAPHRRHGVVYEEISQHRAAQGPADERGHHRVSQGRVPLSQPKVRKILDTTTSGRAAPPASGSLGSDNGVYRQLFPGQASLNRCVSVLAFSIRYNGHLRPV